MPSGRTWTKPTALRCGKQVTLQTGAGRETPAQCSADQPGAEQLACYHTPSTQPSHTFKLSKAVHGDEAHTDVRNTTFGCFLSRSRMETAPPAGR